MKIVIFNESYFFRESRSAVGETKFPRAPSQKHFCIFLYNFSKDFLKFPLKK